MYTRKVVAISGMHIKRIQLLHSYWHQGYQSEMEVLPISCNMGTRDLPICMPSGIHIRQITCAHITTIKYTHVMDTILT